MNIKWNWDLDKANRRFSKSLTNVVYVHPQLGKDTNDGTINAPVATYNKAYSIANTAGVLSSTLFIIGGDTLKESTFGSSGGVCVMDRYSAIYNLNSGNSKNPFYFATCFVEANSGSYVKGYCTYFNITNASPEVTYGLTNNIPTNVPICINSEIDISSASYGFYGSPTNSSYGINANSIVYFREYAATDTAGTCRYAAHCIIKLLLMGTAPEATSRAKTNIHVSRDSYILYNKTYGFPVLNTYNVPYDGTIYIDDYYTDGMTSTELSKAVYAQISSNVVASGGTMEVSEASFLGLLTLETKLSTDVFVFSGNKILWADTDYLKNIYGAQWNIVGFNRVLGNTLSFIKANNFTTGTYIEFDTTKESGSATTEILTINPHEESVNGFRFPKPASSEDDNIFYSCIKIFSGDSPISGTGLEGTIPAGLYMVNNDCTIDSVSYTSRSILEFTEDATHTITDSKKIFGSVTARNLGLFPVENPYPQPVALVRFKKEKNVSDVATGEALESGYWYVNNNTDDCELSNGDVISSGSSYYCETSGLTISTGSCTKVFSDDDKWIPFNIDDWDIDYIIDSDNELIESTVKDIDGNYLNYAKPLYTSNVEIVGNKRVTRLNAKYIQAKIFAQQTHFNDL